MIRRLPVCLTAIVLGILATSPAAAQQQCQDDCYATYEQCTNGCTTYACIEECQYYYNQCTAGCCQPNWVELNRTKIGGSATEFDFLGLKFCRFYEWFMVNEQDVNNCGPTQYRQRCDRDEHVGDWHTEGGCCQYDDPEDIDRTEYCGGQSCS